MTKITIGLAQIHPRLGNLATNLHTHLKLIEQAAEQGAQLVVFPELSLTGYYLQDLIVESATSIHSDLIATLRDATRKLDLDTVVGFVDVSERSNFYIASAYISRGEVVHVHHKVYLPTYGMFEDGRFIAQGDHIRAFDTCFGRMGILICEDFWHGSSPHLLWLDGAEILLLVSASPGRGLDSDIQLGSSRWVNHVIQTYSSLYTVYTVHCNRVGFESGKIFWGGSSIVDPNGEFVTQLPLFDEVLHVQTIDLNEIRRTRSRLPLLRDERSDLTARELSRILATVPRK